MIFKEARCPNCGGELQLPEDKATVKCMYCGGDIIVQGAIRTAAESSVPNWLILAKAAIDGRNYQEAFNYYTKVLEVDPQNYEAWLGKGEAAGWMSTLADFRFPEMIGGFRKAIEYAPVDNKEWIAKIAVVNIFGITIAYHKLSIEHFFKMKSFEMMFEQRKEYADRSMKVISALELAHDLCPDNKEIIDSIIHFCSEITTGRDYFVLDQEAMRLKTKRDLFVEKMKVLDPSYNLPDGGEEPPKQTEEGQASTKPPVGEKASSGCFIASAAMGSFNHPVVVLLREFRDAWLLKRYTGRIFVRYYYILGPYAANFIRRSILLKRLSYFFIIRPLVWFARVLLKN
jgi:DNA-directed RNA polymerase subunit RPC12/RpoP